MSESSNSIPSSSTSRKKTPAATTIPEAEPPLFSASTTDPMPARPAEPLDAARPFESASPLPDEMPPLETPMTGSGPSPAYSVVDKRNLKKTIAKGLDTLGRMLNRVVADDIEGPAGLYLFNEDDQEGIADPAAELLARRGLVPTNPDLHDLLRGLFALFNYLEQQLSLKRDVRRARAAYVPAPEQEDAA